MGIIEVLNSVKGTVLDAGHVELLKSAYDMQNKNIEQLQTNNSLLVAENDRLKKENEELQVQIEKIRVESPANKPRTEPELSATAIRILRLFGSGDRENMSATQIRENLSDSRLAVSAAIDELDERKLMKLASVEPGRSDYRLTSAGKIRAMSLASSDSPKLES